MATLTPPSSVPSTAPSSAEPTITQLHQGNLEMQRQLLAKKLAERSNDHFTSPTDQLLTPCSQKLQDHKKKAFAKSAKPKSLASRFSAVSAAAAKGKENEPVSSANPSQSPNSNPFGN